MPALIGALALLPHEAFVLVGACIGFLGSILAGTALIRHGELYLMGTPLSRNEHPSQFWVCWIALVIPLFAVSGFFLGMQLSTLF